MSEHDRPIRGKVTRMIVVRSDADYLAIGTVRGMVFRVLIGGLVVGFCLGLVVAALLR